MPLESADMYYDIDSYGIQTTPEVLITSVVRKKDIPCWSLAALLGVLPFPQLSKDKLGSGKEGWMVVYILIIVDMTLVGTTIQLMLATK